MPSNLRIGCRVSTAVGPLQEASNAAGNANRVSGGRQTRRRRLRFSGTILRSMPGQQWTVLWDDNGFAGDHPSQTLRYEGAATRVYSEEDVNLLLRTKHLGDQVAFCRSVDRNHYPSNSRIRSTQNCMQTVNPFATVRPATTIESVSGAATEEETSNAAGDEPTDVPQPAGIEEELNLAEENQNIAGGDDPPQAAMAGDDSSTNNDDPDNDADLAEEDMFDTQEILFDILQAEQLGNQPSNLLDVTREKQQLEGSIVDESKNGKAALWTVVGDISRHDLVPTPMPDKPGLKGFDFNNKTVLLADGKNKRINTLSLIQYLWPGDWNEQLQKLNVRIQEANEQIRNGCKKIRFCRLISPKEFWVFWGLILVARLEGRKGELWDTCEPEGYGNKVNMSKHMTQHRFKQLRGWVAYLWADDTKQGTDQWWQISSLFDLYNENRRKTVSTGSVKVLDETMSAFRPQTQKTGNLPHLSFIQRKPEPLGTEFKVVADTKTQMFIHIELQRGRAEMAEKEYVGEMLKTAACTTRLAKNSLAMLVEQGQEAKETYIGDSWFSSVNTVVSLKRKFNLNYIGIIKTSTNRYPKDYLSQKMDKWPAGSHLLLEATIEDVTMYAMGYKYNRNKVIHFIFTKGAGHTEPGKPYEARWKDENNNTRCTNIPRPHVASKYFNASNVIDVGNQSRQHDLRLEKHWISADGYFRIVTTLFGIGMTDAWRAYRFHLHPNHRHFDLPSEEFTSLVARDMLANTHSALPDVPESFSILLNQIPQQIAVQACHPNDQVSALGSSQQQSQQMAKEIGEQILTHTLKRTSEYISYTIKERNGCVRTGKRLKRNRCHECGHKTMFYCEACPAPVGCKMHWLCGRNRSCFDDHLHELCLGPTSATVVLDD